jgi:hypothetical protein
MEAELNYYRRRSVEESKAAAESPDSKVRGIHLELERCYDEKISAIEAELRRGQMRLVTTA